MPDGRPRLTHLKPTALLRGLHLTAGASKLVLHTFGQLFHSERLGQERDRTVVIQLFGDIAFSIARDEDDTGRSRIFTRLTHQRRTVHSRHNHV